MTLWSKIEPRIRAISDRRFRQFYLQRLVTDLDRRERRANSISNALPQSRSPLAASDAVTAEALIRDGYAPVPNLVNSQQVADLRAYFGREKCSDPYRPQHGSFVAPENAPPDVHVAFFDEGTIIRGPHTLAIANHPRVLAIVAKMLGAKPTISFMTAWWSMPTGGKAENAELFHRDVDELRFVKLFVYLTDVDERSGPHMFAMGSHRVNKLTEIRRYQDAEVEQAIGADRIARFTGEAGTCFLENTWGLHRGVPPSDRPRLVFQVLYTLRVNPYGPAKPIYAAPREIEGVPLDPYINRVYCQFN